MKKIWIFVIFFHFTVSSPSHIAHAIANHKSTEKKKKKNSQSRVPSTTAVTVTITTNHHHHHQLQCYHPYLHHLHRRSIHILITDPLRLRMYRAFTM